MPSVLETKGLTKRFGGLTAVNNVALQVETGSIAALIGPNGAGKTTLFNMLAGSTKVSSGSVWFEGRQINGLPEYRIVGLGIGRTFQHMALFPTMSVLENVMVGASSRLHSGAIRIVFGGPGARREEHAARENAEKLLEFVGIASLRDRLARELSYGDGRRVAIARAMASEPRLLMLDEPAAGMPTVETMRLMDLIKSVNARGVSILVIEHNMDFIMKIADHITVLDHGDNIASGSPEDIRTNPRVVEAYLGSGDPRTRRHNRRVRES